MADPAFHSLRARLLLLVFLAILPAFGMIVYAGTEQRRVSALNARREVSQLVRLAVVQHENTVRETRLWWRWARPGREQTCSSCGV